MMLLSMIAAFIMPLELFLFAYAVLGPLHYLTEISWLHDRKYFTKSKHDFLVLVAVGVLVTLDTLGFHFLMSTKAIFFAFTGSALMAFVRNVSMKALGFVLLILFSNLIFTDHQDNTLTWLSSILLPTLIHVFVFTGVFILVGALKSKSKSGMISFAVFLLCPLLLGTLFQSHQFIAATQYGKDSYFSGGDGFFQLNLSILQRVFDVDFSNQPTLVQVNEQLFGSATGITLMRLIAFSYMYHYLNWFSKTEVIRWHQVSRARILLVVLLWVASVVLYSLSYSLGLKWLAFLSFTHVLLEFPLNMNSFAELGKQISMRLRNSQTIRS